jgi:ribose/xylose/arabinose/galactoside ABC-type transport system permease subunit
MTGATSSEPQESAAAVASVGSTLRRRLRGSAQTSGALIAMLALFLVTGLHNHLFWSLNNLKVLAENVSFTALAAVGTAILIISGSIDLSIGSLMGLVACVSAMLAKVIPVPLAFILAVALGGGIGGINGLIVWNVSISPIIVTLGGLTLLEGVSELLTNGLPVSGQPASFTHLGNFTILGLPLPVWVALAAAVVGMIYLTFTREGRQIYAVGGNREASEAAGVNVRRIVIGTFIVSGLLVGLTGVLEASLYGVPDDTFGTGFELSVITGVLVGGVSFAGGSGGIGRAIIGCLLLQVVSGAIVSFGINPDWANVLTGGILIIAVSSDQIVQRQRTQYQKVMAMREAAALVRERRGIPPPPPDQRVATDATAGPRKGG